MWFCIDTDTSEQQGAVNLANPLPHTLKPLSQNGPLIHREYRAEPGSILIRYTAQVVT